MNSENSIKNNSRPAREDVAVSELHHRIKNTLQNLVSYIGIMLGERETVGRREIEKLIRFVHSIAALYAISLRDLSEGGDRDTIRLEQVIESIVQLNTMGNKIVLSDLPRIPGTHRQAATLGLILNELLDNAVRFGDGNITVTVSPKTEGGASLRVTNGTRTYNGNGSAKTNSYGAGLRLVELMSQADLNTTPVVIHRPGQYEVSIDLPRERF